MEPADRRDQDKARVPAAGPTAEPQWLTGEERDAWIPLVGMLIKLPAALDAQLQRDASLSHFEYMVLSRLSEAPGHTLRMSDLAILANGSLSRLSHVVTRLERRGWVRRESCPADGRYTNAVLTARWLGQGRRRRAGARRRGPAAGGGRAQPGADRAVAGHRPADHGPGGARCRLAGRAAASSPAVISAGGHRVVSRPPRSG